MHLISNILYLFIFGQKSLKILYHKPYGTVYHLAIIELQCHTPFFKKFYLPSQLFPHQLMRQDYKMDGFSMLDV